MLRRIQITDPGDSSFMLGEQVEWWVFEEENEKIINAGAKPAVAEPLLLGVTKASLSTDSFISAASFQETTKVLTNAAMGGRVDRLLGLKENVIMGRLVPAGTGLEKYRVEEE
jgi:DNA-directed RNA polymerase subunit beta'